MDIMKMTVDELLLITGLAPVAQEAKDAAELINKAYSQAFGIGVDVIEVWRDRDAYNYEYLTHSGVWQARYLNQTYDVKITADEIFKYFRAEFMVKNGFASEFENGHMTQEAQLIEVCRYLRSFIHRTASMVSEKEEN